MSVPIILPNGAVLIYGFGISRDGSEGLPTPTNTKFVFGTIYQIWDGGATFVYGGDQVMWKQGEEVCQLTYAGNPYTLINARLVTKQDEIH
jgi:hypothetical protein